MGAILGVLLSATLPWATSASALDQDQVLVLVGERPITMTDLETAIGSSTFSVQFPAMDPNDQAALRGDILKRLVAGQLLLLEAERRGLDNDPAYLTQMSAYKRGILYRAYMDKLRADIRIPEAKLAELAETLKDQPEALEPAQNAYISAQYRVLRALALENLKTRYHLVMHDDRLKIGAASDTVLAQADNLNLRLSDILGEDALKTSDDEHVLRDRLFNAVELELVVRAAEAEALDVSAILAAFRAERLPALLLEHMDSEWVTDDILQAYFKNHPGIGYVPEVRHVAQIVVATADEAEALHKRILAGESLYVLAGEHSIDPIGRQNKGDMGWVKEGSGMAEIETAIKDLKDGELSPVIKTAHGYHLVAIYGRSKSQQRPFEVIKDRLHQQIFQENLIMFVNQLSTQFTVDWKLPMAQNNDK
ncbi:hypothetical protein BEN30_11525 [Magnetovibrio blakemorei]|uniref:Parvulin-like PPIase n=1 Tax=Magnetovibrio blakemorei TaxID=28181 RepID=A0A1E5Q757_9PROT|nr:hypothetical protein BEN30_11525 [Magnetovibrio blakemorei]